MEEKYIDITINAEEIKVKNNSGITDGDINISFEELWHIASKSICRVDITRCKKISLELLLKLYKRCRVVSNHGKYIVWSVNKECILVEISMNIETAFEYNERLIREISRDIDWSSAGMSNGTTSNAHWLTYRVYDNRGNTEVSTERDMEYSDRKKLKKADYLKIKCNHDGNPFGSTNVKRIFRIKRR